MYNTDLPSRAELPSARRLLQSTAVALLGATAVLVTVVLPAEFGRDPTGAGRWLGLTAMGEIKTSLQREAAADAAKPAVAPGAAAAEPPAGPTASPAAAAAQDELSVTLRPGQAAEVKLDMLRGATVRFEWTADGAVNFDNHGDPPNPAPGFYHGYGKGRQVMRDAGTLTAAFDGKHGFFWRNRGDQPVTIRLKTAGAYSAIKQML